jgi:GTP cyclohydrolase I
MRGVQARGSQTITSSVHGVLRENAASRQEFFMLTRDV